jgi:hypothetical protein
MAQKYLKFPKKRQISQYASLKFTLKIGLNMDLNMLYFCNISQRMLSYN